MDFDGSHPVASAAARKCRADHGHTPSWTDVACFDCWDAAIVADKEAAAEAGLDLDCPADPELVDEVAVARAVTGAAVELTVAEWQAAKRALMHRRQVSLMQAQFRLSRNVTVVDSLGNPLDGHLLAMASRGAVSPARVVTLAAAQRFRRRQERRARYTAALAA